MPGAPATYTDAVGGEPVTPMLFDSTQPPVPLYRTFSLLGTQDRYFYRGANPAWRLNASTVLGQAVSAASSKVVHQAYGTTGSLTDVAGDVRDLSVDVQLALSHQDVTLTIANASHTAQLPADSQKHLINLSNTAKVDRQFGQSSPYATVDETQAGTVPVSLPFDMSYVESSIASNPQELAGPSTVERREFDRWGEVTALIDPRNPVWQTTWNYGASGQVLSQTKPEDSGTGATSRSTYDLGGRTASVTDANGKVTLTWYDNAGNLTRQTNADGGNIYNRFDAFGNKTETWVQTGSPNEAIQYSITRYQYDLQGQLKATERPEAYIRILGQDANGYVTENVAGTQVEHWRTGEAPIETYGGLQATASLAGTGGSVERYEYDSLGRRTRATVSAGDVASETTRTDYDLQGLVVRQTTADTKVTVYAYDEFGRKSYEREAAGRQMSWSYQGASDLVKTHVGLDGVTVTYSYDKADQLARLGSTARDSSTPGQDIDYRYDAQGRVIKIDDHATNTLSTRRYDAAGNVIRERTEVTDGDKTLTVQDNYLRYDAQGRLAQVADTRMKIDYSYDAVGNRTRVRASYLNDSDQLRQYDWAYKFDAMNRMEVEDGQLGADGKAGITQLQGREYSYDFAGRKVSASSWGKRATHYEHKEYTVNDQYDPDTGVTSERLVVEDYYGSEAGETTETYSWDAAGNLTAIDRDGIEIQRRHYDALGRLVQQETPAALADVYLPEGTGTPPDYMPPPPISGPRGAARMLADLGYTAQTTTLSYEAGGDRVKLQSIRRVGYDPRTSMEDGQLQANVTYQYNSASGNLETTTSLSFADGTRSVTTNTWSAVGDGYRQAGATTSHTNAQGQTTAGEAKQRYDANGNLYKLVQGYNGGPNPDRKFFLDAQGRILQSRQLDKDGHIKTGPGMRENFTIVGGEQLARAADTDIEDGYKDSFGQASPFGMQASVPRQATGARSYVVQEGDTLQRIAQTVWGDSSLWYLIAEANGLADGSAYDPVKGKGIRAGQVLTLPDAASVGVGSRTSASTLRPYDPTEAIGNTAPNLPPPRKKGSLFGKLLMMIVAIVVTIYTAGALSGVTGSLSQVLSAGLGVITNGAFGGALGSFVAGGLSTAGAVGTVAAATAVGSIVSQGVGVAAGVQDEINWRGVALSAFSAGLTAGLGGQQFGLGQTGGAVARTLISSTLTQGVAVALGQQSAFSWKQTAAAVVSAPLAGAMGDAARGVFGQIGSATGLIAGGAVYGITSQVLTKAMGGGKATLTGFASDAYGYLLSRGAVDQMLEAARGQQGEVLAETMGPQPQSMYSLASGDSGLGVRLGAGSGIGPSYGGQRAGAALGDFGQYGESSFTPDMDASTVADLRENLGLPNPEPDVSWQIAAGSGPTFGRSLGGYGPGVAALRSASAPMTWDEFRRKEIEQMNADATSKSGFDSFVNGFASSAATLIFGGDGPTRVTPQQAAAWRQANPNAALGEMPTLQYEIDVGNLSMKPVIGITPPMGESLMNIFSLGTRPVGKGLGTFFGGLSIADDDSLSVDTRNQGAYDAGGSSLVLPAAVLMTGAPGLRFNLKGDFATGAYAPKTAYSVAYEMELSPASYGRSPHFHKKEAAASYRDTVEKYPDYGEMMEPLGIPRDIGAQGVKSTPSTWIWEHASTSTADGRTGVMRLVPREQHTPGSQWWRIIHPDPGAAGGYAEWARPAGAPRR